MGREIYPVNLEFGDPIYKFAFGEQSTGDFCLDLAAGAIRFDGDEGCIRMFTAEDIPGLRKAFRQAKGGKDMNRARMLQAVLKTLKQRLPESDYGWVNLFAQY